MSHHPAYTFAGLTALGGAIGYAKTKSRPSLIAGLAFGALFGTAGYLIQNNQDYGVELATGTSVLLLSAMAPRALKTRKPVPIGLSTVALLGTYYYGKKIYEQVYGV
ncbi:transmembrane proteins 14C-domain-containing protein [Gaertneriomyces semiglobifer]|nr:transmembrane proteins 14C-domain-containing protein [Gaertneriomyces semiglobifer]